jgi:glycosyltransferase involved in cell wall biosynthesis
MAQKSGERVVLRLERIPEQDLAGLLAAADAVVLPFRRVTTSGSAMLALSHGRPLIVPDLPALADLPDEAVLRYDGKVPALTAALTRLARAHGETLATMSRAARRYAFHATWEEIAATTRAEMLSLLGTAPETDRFGRPVRAR